MVPIAQAFIACGSVYKCCQTRLLHELPSPQQTEQHIVYRSVSEYMSLRVRLSAKNPSLFSFLDN